MMKKLGLSGWANIAEIFASIVLVLSVIYVGLELDRNTKATQSSSWQGIIDKMNDLDAAEASDPEFASIIMRGETAANSLTAAEEWRFDRMAQARLGQLEFAFLALNDGTLGQYHWGAVEGYTQHMICLPGYLSFWRKNGATIYHQDFVEHVSLIIPNCPMAEKTEVKPLK
jgi:hypothetical protein